MENEPARVRGHVLGRAEVDVAPLDVARLAGVGLRREAQLRHPRHALDGFEHGGRADRTVDPDDRGAPTLELGGKPFRRRAVESIAVLFGGHLRHDGQI